MWKLTAALFLCAALGTGPAQAQGNQTPSTVGGGEGSGGTFGASEATVGAGTTTEVTKGTSGGDGGGGGPPEVRTDVAAGRNAECRALEDGARRVACLQGYAQLQQLAGGRE